MSVTFNFISCEKKMPIPQEVLEEFPAKKWEKVECITSDLYKFNLQKFEITDDDKLFLMGQDGTIEKQDFTGEIVFSTMQLSEDYDYILYFKSLFFKGELKELTLEKLDKKENSLRIAYQETNEKIAIDYHKNKHKLVFKLCIFYLDCVSFVLSKIRTSLGFLINLTWKVQRLLT